MLETFSQQKKKELTDIYSRRVCMYFAIFILCIFLTNMGDVISEVLFGGALAQHQISIFLKVVCGVAFLFCCVPAILKDISKAKLFMIYISLLVVFLNFLFFPDTHFKSTIFTFYSLCATSFLAADTISDYSQLRKYLLITSRIVAVLAILFLLFSHLGKISSLQDGYSMGLGYSCIVCEMILIWNFLTRWKILDLMGGVGILFLIVRYGSRGPLVGIALFILVFGIRYFHAIGRDVLSVLLLSITAICVLFFPDIMRFLYIFLNSRGVTSRTLYLLANELNHSSGRDVIWNTLIHQIQTDPFLVRGIDSDYFYVNTYAHNIIIELVFQFGIIIGGALLFFLIRKIIGTIKLNIKEDASVICLIYFFSSVPSEFFSGYLWIDFTFWIWLAMFFGIQRRKRQMALLQKKNDALLFYSEQNKNEFLSDTR